MYRKGYINVDDIQYHNKVSDVGEAAIPINLLKEDQEYLSFLNKLGNDIIKNPNIAKDFAKNPQKYTEKYGFHQEVNIDESLLHYILTLGDEEIISAIENKDFLLVVKLMREKGYIKYSHTNLHLTKEQIEYLKKMGQFPITRSASTSVQDSAMEDETHNELYVVVCVISQLAVIYNIAAAINAGVAINLGAVVYVKLHVKPKDNKTLKSEIMESALNQNLSLSAISAKSSIDTTFLITNKYIEDVTNNFFDLIKKSQPNLIKDIGEDNVKDIIRLQLFAKMD